MARVFDWERLLRERRIPHIDSGPNVKRGELAIRCPFCGSADPSMHMGLNLETGWYSCWRNRAQHSGKSPLRLLMKLLHVSYGQAREIAGLGDDYVDPEGFDAMAAKLMQRDQNEGRKEQVQRRILDLDPGFAIIEPRGRTRSHFDYLVEERGFYEPGDIARLGRVYGVCAGLRELSGNPRPGESMQNFSHRVILPYYQDGDLVTWTGRAIGPSKFRYLDLKVDDSILAPKETLYNHDAMYARGPRKALVLVEGPFDALKLDFYGRAAGVRAVALSTNSVKPAQGFLLQAAADLFPNVLVMMDNANALDIVDSMRLAQELAFIPQLRFVKVPNGAKDPGALRAADIRDWSHSL